MVAVRDGAVTRTTVLTAEAKSAVKELMATHNINMDPQPRYNVLLLEGMHEIIVHQIHLFEFASVMAKILASVPEIQRGSVSSL